MKSQKPPLKWYHRHKNPHNTTVQLQTPIGSRNNRHLIKFTNSKLWMCARFATSFTAPATPVQSFSLQSLSARLYYALRVLMSMEPQTEKNQNPSKLSQSNNPVIFNKLNVTCQAQPDDLSSVGAFIVY